jgi:hypothetical protein
MIAELDAAEISVRALGEWPALTLMGREKTLFAAMARGSWRLVWRSWSSACWSRG